MKANGFDPVSGKFLGALQDGRGAAIHISGLWGLTFGNGSRANPLQRQHLGSTFHRCGNQSETEILPVGRQPSIWTVKSQSPRSSQAKSMSHFIESHSVAGIEKRIQAEGRFSDGDACANHYGCILTLQ